MKLNEIINLEYQLYKDAQSDPASLRDRDRKIGREYNGSEDDRISLFRFWLKKLEDVNSYPGHSVASALTFLRYMVFFFFLVSGATTCAGILAYDGSRPVNIVNFIAVFVGIEILLYLLFFLNILPGSFHNKIPLIGDFYRFAGFIFTRITGTVYNHLYKNKTGTLRRINNIFHRTKARHSIYQKIEKWSLFSLTQLGGFAFSLGALAACTYLIFFSDLAFAWNTTLDVSPEFFHRIVTAISAPWALILKDLVPGIDLVEATRYFRMGGNYSSAHSSAIIAGGWWPFLICILVFYGLIPRFVLLMLSRFILLRAQGKAPFLSAEFDSLHRRLTSPVFSSRIEDTEHHGTRQEKQELKTPDKYPHKSGACYLIVWEEIDLPETEMVKIIKAGFQWDIIETSYAGMYDNNKDDLTLKHFEESKDDAPILLLAESWETPGKAVIHFLGRLRSKIKADRPVVIGLLNLDSDNKTISPARTDWQNWQDAAVRANDPFISVEPVSGAA